MIHDLKPDETRPGSIAPDEFDEAPIMFSSSNTGLLPRLLDSIRFDARLSCQSYDG